MKECLQNYMRPGIVFHMIHPATMGDETVVVENLRELVKDSFWECLEVISIKDKDIFKQAKAITDNSGMDISYGAHVDIFKGGLNLNSLVEAERTKAVSVMKRCIDDAYAWEAEDFTYVCGQYDEAKKEEALEALIKSTKEMCDYAKSKGDLKILHESFDYDVDKKVLVGPVEMAKRYADAMSDYDNFALLADLSHLPMLRESPKTACTPIAKYLKKGGHCHMGNCIVAEGDGHPRYGVKGAANDVNSLAEYLRTLLKLGVLNTKKPPMMSFEIKTLPGEDATITMANAQRILQKAWRLV